MKLKFECKNWSKSQRDYISGFLGVLLIEWEYFDQEYYHAIVDEKAIAGFTSWANDQELEYRLI